MINEPDKLSVSEIFYSLQGEGRTTGTPSVFIRLAGCNLSCVWCDSKYTWKTPIEIHMFTFTQLLQQISTYNSKNIIWTGGEPSLRIKLIYDYIKLLQPQGYTHEIESNGTIKFDPTPFSVCTISPKLLIEHERGYGTHENYLDHFKQFQNVQFKFVIDSPETLHKTLNLIEQYQLAHNNVYLMPQGITYEQVRDNSYYVIKACKQHNINYSARLHIMLWGNQRGT